MHPLYGLPELKTTDPYEWLTQADLLFLHAWEHAMLHEVFYNGDTDWPAFSFVPTKRQKACDWLEGMFGDITRERGFTDDMSDEEVYALIEGKGLVWHNGRWHDFKFEEAVRDARRRGIPEDMIWGQP